MTKEERIAKIDEERAAKRAEAVETARKKIDQDYGFTAPEDREALEQKVKNRLDGMAYLLLPDFEGEEAIDIRVALQLMEEHDAEIARLQERLDWLRQTVHRAYHEGPLNECKKNTCDAALQVLGLREV